jgi:hypothetical protein
MSIKAGSRESVSNLYSNSRDLSLEERYADLIFADLEVFREYGFQDYHRAPNEWPPQNVQPHLGQTEPGYTVVTGSERGFYDLLFSEESLCKGLIFRDINPKNKAYIDFNLLLLRICDTRQEYVSLSEPFHWASETKTNDLASRISVITEKTQNSDLPLRVKNYYLKNIKAFAGVYLSLGIRNDWRKDPRFQACFYHQNEDQFLKLQRYAKSGNIIATVGDINDLRFLKEIKINIVDTSNIHDYCIVNLQGEGDFAPKVIWTELSLDETRYFSAPYQHHAPLTVEEKKEFDQWIALFQQTHFEHGKNKHFFQIVTEKLQLEASSLRNNPKEVLHKLRNYMQNQVIPNPDLHVIHDPVLGYLCLSNPNVMNGLGPDEMKILCNNPQMKHHLPFLVGTFKDLKMEYYFQLLHIEGAHEVFEQACLQNKIDLNRFIYLLNTWGALDTFTKDFGRVRFAILKSRCYLSQAANFALSQMAQIGSYLGANSG